LKPEASVLVAWLVLFVVLLLAWFEWILQPLMLTLQGLFSLRALLWLPGLALVWLLLASPLVTGDPDRSTRR